MDDSCGTLFFDDFIVLYLSPRVANRNHQANIGDARKRAKSPERRKDREDGHHCNQCFHLTDPNVRIERESGAKIALELPGVLEAGSESKAMDKVKDENHRE